MTAKYPSEVDGPYLKAAKDMLPHGYVIVPQELTPEMGAAGYSEMTNLGGHSVETMWKVILAAAPKI